MSELIAERTGAEPGSIGGTFTLNPKVDDIPDEYCPEHNGIRLVSMGGGTREGGSGCLCPENAFLRALMGHVIFLSQDVVILDMVAGIEHLTRGTARGVDALIVVVEPGARSLETAGRIRRLATDLGIPKLLAVGNKVRNEDDVAFIRDGLDGIEAAAFIPYSAHIIQAGMGREGVSQALEGAVGEQIRKLQASLEARFPMPGR
jgi:CO dehydrogenase maturation factor